MSTNNPPFKPEVPSIGPIKTGMSFEFAYSKLARHVSVARSRLQDEDGFIRTRDELLREQVCEAYEFIEMFEQMMTTAQVKISNSIATSNQTIATEDFRRMFPRPVSAKENFDANGETK
jgi:hypothetical protein